MTIFLAVVVVVVVVVDDVDVDVAVVVVVVVVVVFVVLLLLLLLGLCFVRLLPTADPRHERAQLGAVDPRLGQVGLVKA